MDSTIEKIQRGRIAVQLSTHCATESSYIVKTKVIKNYYTITMLAEQQTHC